jgi:hypothetical protein
VCNTANKLIIIGRFNFWGRNEDFICQPPRRLRKGRVYSNQAGDGSIQAWLPGSSLWLMGKLGPCSGSIKHTTSHFRLLLLKDTISQNIQITDATAMCKSEDLCI